MLYVLLPHLGFTAILEVSTRELNCLGVGGRGGAKSRRKEEDSETTREKG